MGEILPDIKGGSPLSQRPPGTPTNPRYGSLPNLYPDYPRKPVLVDSTGSIASNVTSQTLSGLSPLPPPDPNLPISGQEKRSPDQPIEDIYAKITPKEVSPLDIGTPNAFGGTAGITESVPPSIPRDPAPRREDPLSQLNTSKLADPGSPNSQAIKTTAVLNRNGLFSYADYEKIKLGQQAQKLFDWSQQANRNQEQRAEAMRFYNLSLQEIAQKTVHTLFMVFQDLLEFWEKKRSDQSWQESAKELGSIFTQGDRIIYVGVAFVLLSLLIMVVFLSS